ncbi:MAG: 3-mercaptopyruvate sulfurtransferase, partial [Hyphomicrobiales bacterium]
TIVVYDTYGFFCAAARVWWMFRIMGHDKVKVLNGGMPKWLDEDLPVEEGPPAKRPPREFQVSFDASQVYSTDQILQISRSGGAQLLDARSPQRFTGELGEPRPCQRLGHIPGSINVYFKDFIEYDGALKPMAEVKKLLDASPVDLSRPIVTTCGSGVTAAVMNLIFTEIGVSGTAMYDGSWSAWGCEDSGLPVATGPEPGGDA